jgi:hypothetical protein
VDAAVVATGADVALHGRRLRVLAQHVVVVRGPRRLHRPQRDALDAGREQACADQPVGLLRALSERALLDQGSQHVGHRLVEGAGLAEVAEVGRVLGQAVRQFVGDDVDRDGEVEEDLAVTVAEDHLFAVPEGVPVLLVVVDGRVQRQSGAVDGAASVGGEQFEGGAEARVRPVDGGVLDGLLTLAAGSDAGQVGAAPGVVDGPARPVGRGCDRARRGAQHRGQPAAGALRGVGLEGAPGRAGHGGVVGPGELVEDVRRHDAAEDRGANVHERQCGIAYVACHGK